MYNLQKRISDLEINCSLGENLSWNTINSKIDEMNNSIDDDIVYHTKVNMFRDLDKINYQLCVGKIVEQCSKSIKYNKENRKILLFSFDIDDHCPITNYSYLTIFFGVTDIDANTCFKKYKHIFKIIKHNIYFEIQNKEKIHFKLFFNL